MGASIWVHPDDDGSRSLILRCVTVRSTPEPGFNLSDLEVLASRARA